MDYTPAAILLFCIIISTGLIALFRKIEAIENKLDAIIKGGNFVVPKVAGAVVDGMHLFELAGKAIAQLVKERKVRKIKNTGAPVLPDVSDELLKRFAGVLLDEIEKSSVEDVSLTEPTWIVSGKFKELTGGSRDEFVACMDRFEAAKIVMRLDKKGTRGWKIPYNSITSKLKKILKG